VTAIAAMEGARSLADVAASAGYCDQAHLNREFRRFTATSPGDYLRRRNGPPGHFVP
jgi:AraC-like DNA-binding protein